MKMRMDIDEARTVRNIQNAAVSRKRRLTNVLMSAGSSAEVSAQRSAPKGETRELVMSIHLETGQDSLGPYFELSAGPDQGDVEWEEGYAGYVEFGTINMDAQPFIRPALGQAISRVKRAAGR